MYTLDTNAIIYYLKSEIAAATVLEPMFVQDIALYVSAITDQEWREEIILREAWPTVFADLGDGVLDTAMVETAAYYPSKAAPAG